MHRTLKLHHHKHTGKLLHHRHTSYWALLLLALIAGLIGFMTVEVARADNLVVSARIAAPVPSGAPTFTSPADGTVVDTPMVTFTGTCPVITPAILIVLYEGSQALGSTQCQSDGTFTVRVQLSPGAHTITATVMTITDDTGESSTPLHITYTPRVASNPSPSRTPSIPAPDTATTALLDIISDKPFLSFGARAPAQWQGRITGGTPPYKLTIVWGDDTVTIEKNLTSAPQTYLHHYKNQHIYTVSFTVTDQSGASITRYLVAVNLSPATTAPAAPLGTSAQIPSLPTFIGLYFGLLLLILILWRYELLHHRQVVGVPLRYNWQSNSRHRQKTHLSRHP